VEWSIALRCNVFILSIWDLDLHVGAPHMKEIIGIFHDERKVETRLIAYAIP